MAFDWPAAARRHAQVAGDARREADRLHRLGLPGQAAAQEQLAACAADAERMCREKARNCKSQGRDS